MGYKYNVFTGNLDIAVGTSITNPLIFKGSITVDTDFPLIADVDTGWFYTITADVTDDDGTKTNTGQSFLSNDEIAWNGTDWTLIGNSITDHSSLSNLNWASAGHTIDTSFDFNNNKGINLLDPTSNQEAATKKYVDDNSAKLDDGTADGQMTFWNGTSWTNTATSELFWDDTNKRVGIGTDSPTEKLDVNGKIALNGTQVAYLPTAYTGTLILGDGGGSLDTGADYNTFVGIGAGFNNTTGSYNTANGYTSLYANTTGDNNTASGYYSLRANTTGTQNTTNGYYSLRSNTTGSYNTASGVYSLYSNTTGTQNTASGYYSLRANTTGTRNTANGAYSLYSNTTGDNNTASGAYSLYSNTTGDNNTANGYASLYANTTGTRNTASGYYSLRANTTGTYNTANGYTSLYANTTGTYNFGLGYNAGRYIADGTTPNETGSYNIFIGANTKTLADGDTNEIVIGNDAVGLGSNSVVLGNDDIVTIALKGNVGIGTSTPDAKLQVVGDARIGADTTNYTEIKTDGEINLHGTARVKKGKWLDFSGIKAPETKPAKYIDHGISGAWEFSDGTDDTVVFNYKVPDDMDITQASTLLISWSSNTSVITESAVWQLEYLYISPGEDTTANAQETLTVTSNVVAQSNGLVVAEITGIDLPSSTDKCVHCRLKRLGADANDDLTDTAELSGVCWRYTSDKLGEGL